MEYKASAFVLKKNPLNEHDLLITLFSLEYGKKTVVAQKAKKSLGSLAALELFNEIKLVLATRKKYDVIYQAEIKTIFPWLREDYAAFALASEFALILDKVVLPDQPEEALYQLFFNCLEALANRQNQQNIRQYFRHSLLKIEGIAPSNTNLTEQDFQQIIREYCGEKNVR